MSESKPVGTDSIKAESPIFSLRHNVVHAFETAKGGSVQVLREAVDQRRVSPSLDVLIDATPARGPQVDFSGVPQIRFHVAHLELIWAFAYSWLLIYEEAVQKPLQRGAFEGQICFVTDLTQRAARLLHWAESLREKATPWPEGLPTPERWASVDEQFYVTKANGIFQDAVSFLAYHEFAHARYRHHEAVDRSDHSADSLATAVQIEHEADDFAFYALVPSGAAESLRYQMGWAVLTPILSSLYLLDGPRALRQKRHPHVHHRMQAMLAKLDFRDASNRFYFTYLCMAVGQDFAQVRTEGAPAEPRTFDTAEEALSAWMDEWDDLE